MELNPYEVTQAGFEIKLTLRQQVIAVVVGVVVTIAAAITMAAFLFGVLVVIGGKSMPAPVSLADVWSGTLGPILGMVAFAIIPVAISLGIYITMRTLRMQRSISEVSARRLDLNRQVEEIRRSLEQSH